MTILQEVRDGVLILLNQAGKPAGVPDFTKRRWLPDEQLGECEVRGAVLFHRESPERPFLHAPITRRYHTIAIQVVTAVAEPDEIDDALEPARAWMVARLGAAGLDGLVHELQEAETVWETARLERIHGAFTTLWRASYQTPRDNLDTRS